MAPDATQLILEYKDLARSLAQQVWRTAPHALELDELCGIANLGLVTAAMRWEAYCEERQFDPYALQYFKTFVVLRVKGAMMDAIRSNDWATRSLRGKAKALQSAGQERGATEKELAERTGMSIKEVRSTVRGMAQKPVSLEAEELDPQANATVESNAFSANILSVVAQEIFGLDEDQQIVLALHYYFGQQLQEVAKTMNISESRASQLHSRAVLAVHAQMLKAAQQKDQPA